jgi:hypothetical protein
MMGLLGRMKKIERETECRPGYSFYEWDVVDVWMYVLIKKVVIVVMVVVVVRL